MNSIFMRCTTLYFLTVYCLVFVKSAGRGVQLRITNKGMRYALDVELKKLEENIRSKRFDQSGRDGSVEWGVSNTRIEKLSFPTKNLEAVAGQGVRASISNAYIQIRGDARYRWKKGWVKISDHIGVTVKARNIRFNIIVYIGRDGNGVPTITSRSCSSDLDVDLDFHGGRSWIYNIFSGMLERRLKDILKSQICKSAVKGINENARKELSTFAVTKQIDNWAVIDYRLTSDPLYSAQFLDIFLKGEFKEAHNPVSSSIPYTTFTTDNESDRMLYVWLSDYTANTAGEVYHRTGRLRTDVNGWDPKVDKNFKLNTKNLQMIVPKIYSKYPDAPIGLAVTSFKAPYLEIRPTGILFHIYARVFFKVKFNGKIIDVFGVNFFIDASLSVKIKGNKIIPQIEPGFKFRADVDGQYKDWILVPLNSRFVYGMLYRIIMMKVNVKLQEGFDIPKLNDIDLKNIQVKMIKGAVRLGCDVSLKV